MKPRRSAQKVFPHAGVRSGALAVALTWGLISGCALRTPPPPQAEPRPAAAQRGAESSPATQAPSHGHVLERSGSRWLRARWEDLPGFNEDRVSQALPAILAGCVRPAPPWLRACEAARRLPQQDDGALRLWLMTHLQPWRVEDRSGVQEGLLTGYYEPHYEARRLPDREFRAAVHATPPDLQQRRPYWTRQQLDTVREAQSALRGRELAYLKDPLDVLVLQIQGSGRLSITEPDGRRRQVRMAFAAHNDHPYGSVGRWLIDKGHLTPAQASWPGIRDWLQRHPNRLQEVLWQNPRVVFFREEALSDPSIGPRGAMGVPLTPERSIAVDPRSVPYGALAWMSSRDPAGLQASLQRLVTAQDTGGAIVGAVRADYFWGWGEQAEREAGRTRQRMALWVLWPIGEVPPP